MVTKRFVYVGKLPLEQFHKLKANWSTVEGTLLAELDQFIKMTALSSLNYFNPSSIESYLKINLTQGST